MDLKEIEILGDHVYSHWYYVSKNLALCKFIENLKFETILDVGSGSGFFSKQLLRKTNAKEATLLDVNYSKEEEIDFSEKKLKYKKSILRPNSDLVLFMDVIEHVENDVAFVKEYVDKTDSGTLFLVTVPAFQFLFSEHDIFLGHYKRYTKSSIESCLSSAGLTVLKCNYFFALILPMVILIRIYKKIRTGFLFKKHILKSDLTLQGKFLNNFLIRINKLELTFFLINKVAGLTIFCLAFKK